MIVSLILILLFTGGGLSLTYLFAEDEPLLWRLGAGNVIGSGVFGLIVFLIACFFGLTTATIAVSHLISLLPALIFVRKANRLKFKNDWQRATGKLEGANFKKIFRFVYYVFFLGLFYFFFERAMIENAQGIFTGASQNYGDLPFHLGAIFSFSDGNNFPPENPSFAFAKFSYPFMADLITASFVWCGAKARDAMLVQNVLLAFSLLVVLERFTFKLTGSRLAAKIAPVLLFFSGGFGFVWFLKDYWQQNQSFFSFIWNLPVDFTISNGDKTAIFRWGNTLNTLFVTQRSLLLGMPLTLLALQRLWEIFVGDSSPEKIDRQPAAAQSDALSFPRASFLVGLLAGTLPLIHVHSLAVLFVVSAVLFFLRLDKRREWIAFGLGVAIIAVPELVWTMTGSATRLSEFVGWNFGWDKQQENFFWFWLKNTGAVFPLLAFGIYLIWQKIPTGEKNLTFGEEKKKSKSEKETREKHLSPLVPFPVPLLYFYLPFLLCFAAANLIKFAPWQWDNIKILIYWFIGSLPLLALALAWLWNKNNIFKAAAVACLIVLTFSGAIDIWRGVSRQINNNVFSRDSVAVAAQIKQKTAPNALFLNAPTFNSAVVLSGRRSLMRYSGHLSSYGIDYVPRENEVKRIYEGSAMAEELLRKNKIEYVLISPEEKSNLTVNEEFFRRFPVVAEVGEYRVYQIKQ